MTKHIRLMPAAAIIAAVLTIACDSPTEPTPPVRSLTVSTPTPAPGSVIPVVQNGSQYFLARESGLFSIPITVTSDREAPYAQLSVYLYDDAAGTLGYCGQNIPDAPTWGPFAKGETAAVSISGFQISRVPCNVTSIRAWLHTRNNGLLIPPTESETVAAGSLTVSYTFRP
jgi:hypothetical protein